MQRLFFSLKFSNAQQQQLLPYQQQALSLSADARATDNVNLHLTLFFLGQTSAEQQQQLLAEASNISVPAFQLTLDYLACFAKPKIIYLAPSHIAPELVALQHQITALCKGQGFNDIHDCYRPHITLARHGVFEGCVDVTPLTLKMTEFALYLSENSHGKVRYRPLHMVQLT